MHRILRDANKHSALFVSRVKLETHDAAARHVEQLFVASLCMECDVSC